MALVNINEGLKEEYSMNKTFSAEYDFSFVRQIACADRFACAIAHVKRKRLMSNDFTDLTNVDVPDTGMQ